MATTKVSAGTWVDGLLKQKRLALSENGHYGADCLADGRAVPKLTKAGATLLVGWWTSQTKRYADWRANDQACQGCKVSDNLKLMAELAESDAAAWNSWGVDAPVLSAQPLDCEAARGIWQSALRIALALDKDKATAGDWNTYWSHVPSAAGDVVRAVSFWTGKTAGKLVVGGAALAGKATAAGLLGLIEGLGPVFWVVAAVVLYKVTR